jgi:hypothetical protein
MPTSLKDECSLPKFYLSAMRLSSARCIESGSECHYFLGITSSQTDHYRTYYVIHGRILEVRKATSSLPPGCLFDSKYEVYRLAGSNEAVIPMQLGLIRT